jgi:hypothetical protein
VWEVLGNTDDPQALLIKLGGLSPFRANAGKLTGAVVVPFMV